MAMMTPKEAAARCGVPIGTLYYWVSQKYVPHVRLGPRLVRFDEDEIDRWLAAKRVAVRTSGNQPREAIDP